MPARLHHERVGAAPRALLLTHGIYGSGGNWRSIARRLVERRPDWAVELVDLRQHGRSEPGAPPHDLAACASDLAALWRERGDLAVLAGHSFGGKVVLATRALAPPGLVQTWLLDGSPSARPGAAEDPDNTVARVLAAMEALPRAWAARDAFVAAIEAAGVERAVAQWLAMNLVPGDGGPLVMRLDLAAVRAMLDDYYMRDLWNELHDPRGGDVEIVVATRSTALTDADRARLAAAPRHVHVHEIASGHWLNVDAPAAMVELFAQRLPA